MKSLQKLSYLLLISSLGIYPAQLSAESNPAKILTEPKSKEALVITELVCKEPIKLKGIPNRLEPIANMRIIIQWSENVRKKIDDDHAQWHNAKNKSVKCKKEINSSYYYCELVATPCVRKEVKPETD